MPKYNMICEDCEHEEILTKSIHLPFPANCPKCKSKKYRVNFAKSRTTFWDKTIKTVGQQAEKNRKDMGEELYQRKIEELGGNKPKPKTPWWRKEGSKPLKVEDIKDVRKYIETGDKS